MYEHDEAAAAFTRAVDRGDVEALRDLFRNHPEAAELLDVPLFPFEAPALVHAAGRRDGPMLDALLDLGADIDARSTWTNGPYSALHRLVDGATAESLDLAEHLVRRGATVDLHAAAGLGDMDRLPALLDEAPDRVSEAGPDGATPLHLARDPHVAALLLDRGADIDRRCVDHRSTPAMWATGGREEVLRLLLDRGATPDLFQAALLDDTDLAARILDRDPEAVDVRVGFGASHPHLGGGDKYVWSLAGADTPLELARRRGSRLFYQWLLPRSPLDAQLVQASRRGDVMAIDALLAKDPELLDAMPEPRRCDALRGSRDGAKRLLEHGAGPDALDEGGASALHHAAWRGDADLAEVLLRGGTDPSIRDAQYDATPLGWANEAGHRTVMNLILDGYRPDIVDAAWLGNAQRVLEILALHPELVNGPEGGHVSPLRSAASNGRTEIVRILLDHGADPHARSPRSGGKALDFARERGHHEVVRLLSQI